MKRVNILGQGGNRGRGERTRVAGGNSPGDSALQLEGVGSGEPREVSGVRLQKTQFGGKELPSREPSAKRWRHNPDAT